MKMTIRGILTLLLVLAPVLAMAQAADDTTAEPDAEMMATPSAPYAQWLIVHAMKAHVSLRALEIMAEVDGVCRTVAASDGDEIGERCGRDETDPMRTGQDAVETPTDRDPVYEVTSALHDRNGATIGGLSLDIEPGTMDARQVLALAHAVRAEIEGNLASKQALFAPAP